MAMTGGKTRKAKSSRACAPAGHASTRPRIALHSAEASRAAKALSVSSADKARQIPSNSNTALLLSFQFAPFLLDQPIELIEHRAIMFAHRVNDARQDRLDAVGSSTEQHVDHITGDAPLELVGRKTGRVEKRPPLLAPVEQSLFVQTIERRHQSRIGQALVKSLMDVADTDPRRAVWMPPNRLHYFALKRTKVRRGAFARFFEGMQFDEGVHAVEYS